MSENCLFVYGTLMNDEVMLELIGRTVESSAATLPGYQCLVVEGQSYPGIKPLQSSQVDGLSICGLSTAEMQILDDYEGDQYQRKSVYVKTSGQGFRQCQTYVFKPEFYHQLTEKMWSNQEFRSNHLHTFTADL